MYPLNSERLERWAVKMARGMAELSKDPSTQVGAIILSPKRRLIGGGYNGLPRGVADTTERLQDRETKYKMTRHAEANAISFATCDLEGSTLICTHPCCAQCAGAAIQAGVAHLLWPAPSTDYLDRWAVDTAITRIMCAEAGVQIHEVR